MPCHEFDKDCHATLKQKSRIYLHSFLHPRSRDRTRKMNTLRDVFSTNLRRARFALPSLVTLFSIACGFASMVITVDNAAAGSVENFRLAATLLVAAGVFDALDGFVARATATTSAFGVQLDSIADVINFGCAPAILLYCYSFLHLADHDSLVFRFGAGASFFSPLAAP
jgi:CDP-diacylglycerol---serine O-phosphatidyltransferase